MQKVRRKALLSILSALCLISLLLCIAFWGYARRERAVLPLAQDAAEEFGVPLALVLAVIRTESNFRADAVSTAGARGLMQLLPQTFAFLRDEQLCEPLSDGEIDTPRTNVRYGTYYLSYLKARFGSWPEALAAYNAGEGRVALWLNDPSLAKDGKLQRIPFPETAAYLEKVNSSFEAYSKRFPTQGE